MYMSDEWSWHNVHPQHLWVFDKLILARNLGYVCGPAGIPVPQTDDYIVRPAINFRMMGRGASVQRLSPSDEIPDGFFWQERYFGNHYSFDFEHGKQILAVQGFRNDSNRLDRFSKWKKVDQEFKVPMVLQFLLSSYQYVNFEVIGTKVIEIHTRYNDDFTNHTSDWAIPVWRDEPYPDVEGDFYPNDCGDRLGLIVEKNSFKG